MMIESTQRFGPIKKNVDTIYKYSFRWHSHESGIQSKMLVDCLIKVVSPMNHVKTATLIRTLGVDIVQATRPVRPRKFDFIGDGLPGT
jgi:hypothetical protein